MQDMQVALLHLLVYPGENIHLHARIHKFHEVPNVIYMCILDIHMYIHKSHILI